MILGEWQFDQARDCLVFLLHRQEVAAISYFTETESSRAGLSYGGGWYGRSIFRDTPGSPVLGPFWNQYNAQRAIRLEIETIALVTADDIRRNLQRDHHTPVILEPSGDSV